MPPLLFSTLLLMAVRAAHADGLVLPPKAARLDGAPRYELQYPAQSRP